MNVEEHTADLPTALGPMRVHVYHPAGEARVPAIAVYSEIYQETGPIKRSALDRKSVV